MKKQILLLLLLICFMGAGNAQAMLIQGNFSGSIDINGSLSELSNGDLFSGQFIYDTDAVPTYSNTSGGTSFSYVPNALVQLSYDVTGAGGTYSYTTNGSTDGSTNYNNAGSYQLDFDYLNGMSNFIGGLDLFQTELLLDFSNTFVTDPVHPLVVPSAGDLVPGNSYMGSVLYMWVLDNEGINPGNAQINGNITSLSLSRYVQPVPEPATVILLFIGLLSISMLAGRKRIRDIFA